MNMKYIFNNKLQEYIENLFKNLKEKNVMIYLIKDEILFLLTNIIIFIFIISYSYLDNYNKELGQHQENPTVPPRDCLVTKNSNPATRKTDSPRRLAAINQQFVQPHISKKVKIPSLFIQPQEHP